MREAPAFVVAYDISDDIERTRVDRVLKGFGFRVQKSVFECRLTRSGKLVLAEQLRRLDLKTGTIKLYRIYGGAHTAVFGEAQTQPDECYAYVL